MNKTKIEWADYTWNPVTGCLHGCPYCYARRVAERFGMAFAPRLGDPGMEGACKLDSSEGQDTMLELEKPYKDAHGVKQPYPMAFMPTLHRYKLDEPEHKTNSVTIFVGSMTDLFGEWVPDEWIAEVFAACKRAPQHTYLFLTKNPARYIKLAKAGQLPESPNMWYGSTATTQQAPIFYAARFHTFVSIEPILGPFDAGENGYDLTDWIIMGAMTGPNAKTNRPKPEWIANVCESAGRRGGVPVFMKDSLTEIVGAGNMLRQLPEGITLHKKEAKA